MDASRPVLINNKCPCVCIRSPIVETLEDYFLIPATGKPGMPSASDLLISISKFDFLVTFVAVHKCLSYMKGLSKVLQDSGLEIGKALDHIIVVSDSLKD